MAYIIDPAIFPLINSETAAAFSGIDNIAGNFYITHRAFSFKLRNFFKFFIKDNYSAVAAGKSIEVIQFSGGPDLIAAVKMLKFIITVIRQRVAFIEI